MRIAGWIGLAGCALVIGGCKPADRHFDTVFHRDSAAVAAELGNIDTSEASSLMPQTQVVRSQPGENQLLYTVPGDTADKASTILFELAPLAGVGTKVVVHLHIPKIAIKDGNAAREVSAAKVESLLRTALSRLGKALDHHDSGESARHDLAMLLVALAVTSHPDLYARLSHDPNGLAGDAMGRLMGGAGEFGEPAMRGTGTDPSPRDDEGFAARHNDDARDSQGAVNPRPMDEARGTDPNPTPD